MRIVVDASVVVAALLRPSGWTAAELSRKDLELVAPTRLIEELDRRATDLLAFVETSPEGWRIRRERLLQEIRLIPPSRYVRFGRDELVRMTARQDAADAPYAACLLSENAEFLWTYDKPLLAFGDSRIVRRLPAPHSLPQTIK